MLEVTFTDGRVRTVSPQHYTTGEPFGGCLMSEFELRLDDLSEGLFLDISHHRLDAQAGRESEELAKPSLQGDASLMMLDPEELERLFVARWNGEVVIARVLEELVVLSRISALEEAYSLCGKGMSLFVRIARLAAAIRKAALFPIDLLGSGDSISRINDFVASEMGIPRNVLEVAIESCSVGCGVE